MIQMRTAAKAHHAWPSRHNGGRKEERARGRFIGLEVTRFGARQSPEQRSFEDVATVAGARYHIVRSIDDVQKLGL